MGLNEPGDGWFTAAAIAALLVNLAFLALIAWAVIELVQWVTTK